MDDEGAAQSGAAEAEVEAELELEPEVDFQELDAELVESGEL